MESGRYRLGTIPIYRTSRVRVRVRKVLRLSMKALRVDVLLSGRVVRLMLVRWIHIADTSVGRGLPKELATTSKVRLVASKGRVLMGRYELVGVGVWRRYLPLRLGRDMPTRLMLTRSRKRRDGRVS